MTDPAPIVAPDSLPPASQEFFRRSLDNSWETPERLLACVRQWLGDPIPLDAATAPDNPTRAARFYSGGPRGLDGLAEPWDAPWFCNPPYGREAKKWLAKMAREADERPITRGVALLSCTRFEQQYLTDTLHLLPILAGEKP
jgi:hypothetical protein